MKRDMELIRKIVLALEGAPTGYAPDELDIEGYTPDEVGYHSYLIMDAGLAEGDRIDHMGSDSPEAKLLNLTWAGHEFADVARNESRWNEAMDIVQEKGGAVTLSVLTQLLTAFMKGAFGLP
jgi:hypothetical protein